jgi:HK97 family phage portal protein
VDLRRIWARVTKPSKPTHYFWLGRSHRYAVNKQRALSLGAFWACIRFITGNLSQIPWRVYVKKNKKTEELVNNPVGWIIGVRANPELSAFNFRQLMVMRCLILGNAYAEIERDNAGRVIALWPIDNDRVIPDRRETTGELYYRITNTDGEIELNSGDMFHLVGLSDDGIIGMSVIAYAARSIALGISQEEYGYGFFDNSGVPSGVLEHPSKLSDAAMQRLRKQWDENYEGPTKSQATLVLEEGMKYNSIALPPEQAQFLTSRQHSIEEIARWFGVPPQKVQQLLYSNYNSIEALSIEVITDTLMPWAKRLEQEVDYKLLRGNWGGAFSRLDFRGLMRGTHRDRAEYYRMLFGVGALSINEIRDKEDLDPIENGDLHLVPLNMAPLEAVASGQLMQPQKQVQEPEPPEPTQTRINQRLQLLLEHTLNEIEQHEEVDQYLLGQPSDLPN